MQDLEDVKSENQALSDKVKSLEAECNEALHEISILRENHAALTKSHQKLTQKNEEISVELLSLVNAKAALGKEIEAKESEMQKLGKQLSLLEFMSVAYDGARSEHQAQ
ncbi:hypothetical protein HK097_005282 [Rhizophlyctis rosea]|uniref:Uncharacterized protein n=1 Tax=Rhizophlyctis rosea TaxID=64517 RepID=A0AAD5SDK2_9FUNG|nr:hypothetical protein HK097_005282 [Rhizophlyctis rosea]